MDPNTIGVFIALTIIGIMFAVGLSFYYIKVGDYSRCPLWVKSRHSRREKEGMSALPPKADVKRSATLEDVTRRRAYKRGSSNF
jgi:hypothetical protein